MSSLTGLCALVLSLLGIYYNKRTLESNEYITRAAERAYISIWNSRIKLSGLDFYLDVNGKSMDPPDVFRIIGLHEFEMRNQGNTPAIIRFGNHKNRYSDGYWDVKINSLLLDGLAQGSEDFQLPPHATRTVSQVLEMKPKKSWARSQFVYHCLNRTREGRFQSEFNFVDVFGLVETVRWDSLIIANQDYCRFLERTNSLWKSGQNPSSPSHSLALPSIK